MSHILSPLKAAGINGIQAVDGKGFSRRGHPILSVYVGDYPEQILVSGAYTGDCARCDCPNSELGEFPCVHAARNLGHIYDALKHLGDPDYPKICREARIKPIQHPFWEHLPYVDIFQSITPDILHQLHQGVIKHLLEWVAAACGPSVIDARVCRMPPNHSIHLFKKGITSLSRVSGTEHRQMSSFLLGVLIDVQLPDGVSSRPLIRATRALLDFLYLAQYPVHTDATLNSLDQSLAEFHANKHVFQTLEIRNNFNLPKLHFLVHYVRSIKLFGTTDNYNTESTERLHIDYAKDAYRATNHKDEFGQMTKWLERQEKMMHHANYAAWKEGQIQHDTVPPGPVATASSAVSSLLASRATWEAPDMTCALHVKMTQHPTLKSVPLETIISLDGYGASSFVPALCRFIAQFQKPSRTPGEIELASLEVHLPFKSLAVFHRIKFWNQAVHGKTTLDSIHAYPAKSRSGEIIAESRFDTALVSVKKGSRGRRELAAPTSATSGMRVGQVRVVFSLPETSHSRLFPHSPPPPRHLAYIEWFSRFTARPDPDLKLYKVSRSVNTRGERSAAIVPVSLIQRSVHLFPKWGRDQVAFDSWTSDTILKDCNVFYVNCFKDRHTYYNVY